MTKKEKNIEKEKTNKEIKENDIKESKKNDEKFAKNISKKKVNKNVVGGVIAIGICCGVVATLLAINSNKNNKNVETNSIYEKIDNGETGTPSPEKKDNTSTQSTYNNQTTLNDGFETIYNENDKGLVYTNYVEDKSFFVETDETPKGVGKIYTITCKNDMQDFLDAYGKNTYFEPLYFINKFKDNEYEKYHIVAYIDEVEDFYQYRVINHIRIENGTFWLEFDKDEENIDHNKKGYWVYFIKVPVSELNGYDISSLDYELNFSAAKKYDMSNKE